MTVYPFNKPIIASNIGGFKEIIKDNITGLLVENLDASSFAIAIEKLLVNNTLRDSMSANIATEFTEGEFSWANIAAATFQFYKENNKLLAIR